MHWNGVARKGCISTYHFSATLWLVTMYRFSSVCMYASFEGLFQECVGLVWPNTQTEIESYTLEPNNT
jgi:hypothetical protein